MSKIKYGTTKEYLTKMVDLVTLLKLPVEFHLKPRQREFLVNTIILNNKGHEIEGRTIVVEICKLMGIKAADVYNYRNILKKKGWFIQTPKGLQLLMVIDFSDREIPTETSFKFSLGV